MKRTLLLAGLCVAFVTAQAQLQAPVLVAPADSAKNVITNADIDWHPALGGVVVSYELEIDLDPNFTNPSVSTVTGSAGMAQELLFNSRYYWRVRAIGLSSNSAWSEVRTFVTYNNNFSLVLPTNTDTIIDVAPTLKWNAIETHINYHYQLDTSASFSSSELISGTLIDPAETTNQVSADAPNLYFDQKYYWRIRAFNSNDTSGWGAAFEFTTPVTVELRDIEDNATGISPDSALRVHVMEGVDDYEFELDSSAVINPSSKEYEVVILTESKFGYSDLLFGVTYRWRARGRNQNEVSDWTEVWEFTTANTITQTAPDEGASTGELPVLEWKTLQGVPIYEVEFADNSSFTDAQLLSVSNGESKVTVPGPQDAGTYYWRVRGILASLRDTSDWSTTRSLVVAPVGIDVQELPVVSMFPNPAGHQLNISLDHFNGQQLSLRMVDLNGKEILNRNIVAGSTNYREVVDISGVANGLYMVLLTGTDFNHSQKITVSK